MVQGNDPDREWRALRRAEAAGVAVTPMAVVASAVEGDFYRWNNLTERIEGALARLHPRDPDPDDLEEALAPVQAWMQGHTLLEAVIDGFYAAIADLPARLEVRRCGASGIVAARGRPALLALRRTWSAAWTLEATLARCRSGAGWIPEPQVTLLHEADCAPDPALSAQVARALGGRVTAYRDAAGRLARLAFDAR
jgi:hypothetical protein